MQWILRGKGGHLLQVSVVALLEEARRVVWHMELMSLRRQQTRLRGLCRPALEYQDSTGVHPVISLARLDGHCSLPEASK